MTSAGTSKPCIFERFCTNSVDVRDDKHYGPDQLPHLDCLDVLAFLFYIWIGSGELCPKWPKRHFLIVVFLIVVLIVVAREGFL